MFNTNTFHTVGDNEVTHRSVSEHFLFEMYTTDGELELDQNGRKNWFSFRPGSWLGLSVRQGGVRQSPLVLHT